jgi:hypothetical protein
MGERSGLFLDGKEFFLQIKHSEKNLGTKSSGRWNDAIQANPDYSKFQKFEFSAVSHDVYTIKNLGTNKYLWADPNGNNVFLARPGKNPIQQWRVERQGQGFCAIQSVENGHYLTIEGAQKSNEANLITQPASGNNNELADNQLFKLQQKKPVNLGELGASENEEVHTPSTIELFEGDEVAYAQYMGGYPVPFNLWRYPGGSKTYIAHVSGARGMDGGFELTGEEINIGIFNSNLPPPLIKEVIYEDNTLSNLIGNSDSDTFANGEMTLFSGPTSVGGNLALTTAQAEANLKTKEVEQVRTLAEIERLREEINHTIAAGMIKKGVYSAVKAAENVIKGVSAIVAPVAGGTLASVAVPVIGLVAALGSSVKDIVNKFRSERTLVFNISTTLQGMTMKLKNVNIQGAKLVGSDEKKVHVRELNNAMVQCQDNFAGITCELQPAGGNLLKITGSLELELTYQGKNYSIPIEIYDDVGGIDKDSSYTFGTTSKADAVIDATRKKALLISKNKNTEVVDILSYQEDNFDVYVALEHPFKRNGKQKDERKDIVSINVSPVIPPVNKRLLPATYVFYPVAWRLTTGSEGRKIYGDFYWGLGNGAQKHPFNVSKNNNIKPRVGKWNYFYGSLFQDLTSASHAMTYDYDPNNRGNVDHYYLNAQFKEKDVGQDKSFHEVLQFNFFEEGQRDIYKNDEKHLKTVKIAEVFEVSYLAYRKIN